MPFVHALLADLLPCILAGCDQLNQQPRQRPSASAVAPNPQQTRGRAAMA